MTEGKPKGWSGGYMKLRLSTLGLLFALAFVAVGSKSAHAQTSTEPPKLPDKVVVQPGDSLTIIAEAHATTYVRIYNANDKIQDPNLIYPGDNLRVPTPDEQIPDRPLPTVPPVAQAPTNTPSTPLAATPAPAQSRRIVPTPAAPVTVSNGSVWDQLARCESGGNWAINTGNGFYGGLQFTLSSWHGVGGSGYPNEASREEQIARAEILKSKQGWGAWPACSSKLGLR